MATAKKTPAPAAKKTPAPAAKKTPATGGDTPWLATGDTGLQRKIQSDALGAARKERYATRFFLKPGEEATITFLDTEGQYMWEHNLKLNGSWGNMVSCVKDYHPCPVCEAGFKSTYTAYYTIIDHRKFTLTKGPRAGQVSQNRKILYPAKGNMMVILADLKKQHKTLAGKTFKVKRMAAEDSNCGSYITLVGSLTADQFAKIAQANPQGKISVEDLKRPLDYKKILAPMSDEELAAIGFGSAPVGGVGDEPIGKVDLNDLVDIG